jgi:hypothetical protein
MHCTSGGRSGSADLVYTFLFSLHLCAGGGQVAIFDATNTTKDRRQLLVGVEGCEGLRVAADRGASILQEAYTVLDVCPCTDNLTLPMYGQPPTAL